MSVFLGIDLGTQGCRVIAARPDGTVVNSKYRKLEGHLVGLAEGRSEQVVESWWPCIKKAIGSVARDGEDIEGVSVDSTSGTVFPIDSKGKPLTNAMMYNDGRATEEAERISRQAREQEDKLGYSIRPSFSIAKILWLRNNRRKVFESAHMFVHAADYVVGMLTGSWTFTDHSNALKSGFDLLEYRWPDFLEEVGIPVEKMPQVVPPGEEVGSLCRTAHRQTGIPVGTPVMAGLTDGCASQIASGAASPGDWETTLGTTLVIKGVTEKLLKDPKGRIYSHLHPEGCWMPGGASSTGGECISVNFPNQDLESLDAAAAGVIPTDFLNYPLVRTGERFPFVDPEAKGFLEGKPGDRIELYASQLEGVAYVERMAYDLLSGLGAQVGDRIFTAGGGSRSEIWLRIRANVLDKSLLKPRVPEAAMGSAILAASSVLGVGVGEMAGEMIRIDVNVEPDHLVDDYQERYREFRSEMDRRYQVGL